MTKDALVAIQEKLMDMPLDTEDEQDVRDYLIDTILDAEIRNVVENTTD